MMPHISDSQGLFKSLFPVLFKLLDFCSELGPSENCFLWILVCFATVFLHSRHTEASTSPTVLFLGCGIKVMQVLTVVNKTNHSIISNFENKSNSLSICKCNYIDLYIYIMNSEILSQNILLALKKIILPF